MMDALIWLGELQQCMAAQKKKFELGDNEVVGVNCSNRLYRYV